MAAPSHRPSDAVPPARPTGDWLVVLAMTLVTASVGLGLYLHMGLTVWLAVVAALSLYVGMLSLHALMRQTDRLHNLNTELRRLEGEIERLSGGKATRAAMAAAGVKAEAAAAPAPASHDANAAGKTAASAPAPGQAQAAPATAETETSSAAREVAAPSSIRDSDVEMIHGLIKKLASEISAGEAQIAQREGAAGARAPGGAAGISPAAISHSAIEASVEALRSTSGSLRNAAGGAGASRRGEPPASSALSFWPEAAVSEEVHAKLASVSEAIHARRADVLLEPILGLDDQRAHHYEVHIRLKEADGRAIDLEALGVDLRDTGLLPLIDCTRISRTANVARRLADRGNPSALFSEISSQSLSHDKFLIEFADAYHERDGFAGQLVLTFSQSDVRMLGARDWSTLDDMRDLGFRFALDAVTDLDMNFEDLRLHGFEFVKLDADVFLHGMPSSDGVVPSSDICRHLAAMGLSLIVGEIDDEAKLARIFGFGVLLGQGRLFGAPRPVKSSDGPGSPVARPAGGAGAHAAA